MIVPDHWAEARRHHRDKDRRVTVRRFGWSNDNEAAAQAMAEERAADALERILAGERLERREPRVPYNGADGVPIREEVLTRIGEHVITRNAYGAHCLNTPRALFADVDYEEPLAVVGCLAVFVVLAGLSVYVGVASGRWGTMVALLVASICFTVPITGFLTGIATRLRGGPETIARRRIRAFLAAHPSWNLRLYETPAGLRLLATHQPFDPSAPEVERFFTAVGADPVYCRMCAKQKCFRARLTAKPWRIGIVEHMRPRPGTWPVDPDRRALREEWVRAYERVAAGFAACRFTESVGSGVVHDAVRHVIDLHDRESRATRTDLDIA